MTFDPKRWLTDTMGFTAEEAAELAPKFEGRSDRLDQFANQRLEAAQADLAAKNEDITREMAAWSETRAADQGERDKITSRIETLSAERASMEARLHTICDTYGLDAATVIPKTTTTPAPTETAGFRPEEFEQRIFGRVWPAMRDMISIAPQLMAISTEHQALTGKPLDAEALVQKFTTALASRTPPASLKAFWEAEHHIPEARTQRDAAAVDQRIKSASDEAYQRGRTEAMVPGSHSVGRQAPVFTRPSAETSKVQRPQPGNRVQQALAAVHSGKYRPAQTTH